MKVNQELIFELYFLKLRLHSVLLFRSAFVKETIFDYKGNEVRIKEKMSSV